MKRFRLCIAVLLSLLDMCTVSHLVFLCGSTRNELQPKSWRKSMFCWNQRAKLLGVIYWFPSSTLISDMDMITSKNPARPDRSRQIYDPRVLSREVLLSAAESNSQIMWSMYETSVTWNSFNQRSVSWVYRTLSHCTFLLRGIRIRWNSSYTSMTYAKEPGMRNLQFNLKVTSLSRHVSYSLSTS